MLDCTNHEIKKEHNRHPNHHDKHRHHRQTRGEKNTRKLPLSEGLTLQGEDPNIAQQPYGWHMDSRVPKGVSRLVKNIYVFITFFKWYFKGLWFNVLLYIIQLLSFDEVNTCFNSGPDESISAEGEHSFMSR